MLSYEGLENQGFINRVTIELSDKQLMGILIDSDYILFVFTKTDIKFGMVLYEITKSNKKIDYPIEGQSLKIPISQYQNSLLRF